MSSLFSNNVDNTSIGSVKDRIEQFDPTKRAQPRTICQKLRDKIDAIPTWVKVGFFVGTFSVLSVQLLALKYGSCVWHKEWVQNWNSRDWRTPEDMEEVSEYCQKLFANMNWCKAQDWCQPLAQLIETLR